MRNTRLWFVVLLAVMLAVPVMALQHLLLFGIVEAVITALLVIYFQRTEPSLLAVGEGKI
jgi:ABC-type Co2+ transport system permease subunit